MVITFSKGAKYFHVHWSRASINKTILAVYACIQNEWWWTRRGIIKPIARLLCAQPQKAASWPNGPDWPSPWQWCRDPFSSTIYTYRTRPSIPKIPSSCCTGGIKSRRHRKDGLLQVSTLTESQRGYSTNCPSIASRRNRTKRPLTRTNMSTSRWRSCRPTKTSLPDVGRCLSRSSEQSCGRSGTRRPQCYCP